MSLYSEDRKIIDEVDKDPSDDLEKAGVKDALEAIIDIFDKEEDEDRTYKLSEIAKCLLFWHGEQSITWNEATKSWISVWDAFEEGLIDEEDVEEYEKTLNITRAYGEIVIAASSLEIPRIHFFPKDASNPVDIAAASEYNKVNRYLDIINNSEQLIQRAHFTLYTQHFVAGYTYYDEDPSHGVIKEPVMGEISVPRVSNVCPNCGADLDSAEDARQEAADLPSPQEIMGQSQSELPAPQELTGQPPTQISGQKFCSTCEQNVLPEPLVEEDTEEAVVGQKEIPRGKVCIQVFGPRNVKLPSYIKELKASPYLIYDEEQSLALLASIYPHMAEKILGSENLDNGRFDRWVRDTTRSRIAGEKKGIGTHRRIWLRPWTYALCGDKARAKKLKGMFPDGVLICKVEDLTVKAMPSDMDTHWAISETALAETIHDDPRATMVIPVNEIENDVLTYDLESLKHNIPEVYFDPSGLDRKAYNQLEARPGMRVPMKAREGMGLNASFFETRGITIPAEHVDFVKDLDQRAQFLISAVPSVWGGYMQGGSKTAQEYESSRGAALQRLSLPIKTVNWWWSNLKRKAVKLYKDNMKAKTDSFSDHIGNNVHTNITISRDLLDGELDRVAPEASSAFPTTWAQKRGAFFEALNAKIPQLLMIWFHPENSTLLKEVIGVPDLYVPNEHDRTTQLWEISQMLQGQPAPVNPAVDNALAHIAVTQAWASSDEGRDAAQTNPQGFMMIMQHLGEHITMSMPTIEQSQDQGQPPAQSGEPGKVEPPQQPPQGGM